MTKGNTFKSIEIPQADSLSRVRRVVDAVAHASEHSVKHLSEETGFSERHVRYRIATARVLGFVADVDGGLTLTAIGTRLIDTQPGSTKEKRELIDAIQSCAVIQAIAPDMLTANEFDFEDTAKRIMRLSALAESTARRRTQVLRAWRRQLRQ